MQPFNIQNGEDCISGLESAADKPVLLALHASGTGAHGLHKLGRGLAANFHVVIPNLNGYGDTEMAGQTVGLSAHIQVLSRLCSRLERPPHVVFGHSMGGLIALKACASGILNPALLVLMEPTAFGILHESVDIERNALDMDRGMILSMQAALAKDDDDTALEIFTEIWNDVPYRKLPASAQAHLRRVIRQIANEAPDVSADTLTAEEIGSIRCPVLLLQSANPPPPIPPIMQKLRALLPDGRLHIVAETGHMGPVLQPDLYRAAITRFINE